MYTVQPDTVLTVRLAVSLDLVIVSCPPRDAYLVQWTRTPSRNTPADVPSTAVESEGTSPQRDSCCRHGIVSLYQACLHGVVSPEPDLSLNRETDSHCR